MCNRSKREATQLPSIKEGQLFKWWIHRTSKLSLWILCLLEHITNWLAIMLDLLLVTSYMWELMVGEEEVVSQCQAISSISLYPNNHQEYLLIKVFQNHLTLPLLATTLLVTFMAVPISNSRKGSLPSASCLLWVINFYTKWRQRCTSQLSTNQLVLEEPVLITIGCHQLL